MVPNDNFFAENKLFLLFGVLWYLDYLFKFIIFVVVFNLFGFYYNFNPVVEKLLFKKLFDLSDNWFSWTVELANGFVYYSSSKLY